MSKENFIVRNMTRKELDIAVSWAEKEGWNPGLHDADCFYAQDPKGFFIGLLDGEPIATVSGVRYGKEYGFGGFYIVKKKYRGKGYGMKTFKKMWEYLGDRNIGADGVLENLKLYERVGLKLDHLNARYQGFGTGSKTLAKGIVKLDEVPFANLLAYDQAVFGFNRGAFLKCWINQPESKGFGVMNEGELLGYSLLRKCHSGYKIGPLFADNNEVAEKLFDSLVGQVGKQEEVFFDIPEVNKGAAEIVKKNKMKKVFATGRIYTKGRPKSMDLDRWYGVTTFELG